MEFKQYPSYKKSGVEWLGGVPEHWVGSKFKYIFQEKQHTKNMNLPFGAISFGSVVYKEDKANLTDELKENYQEVLQGEFLVNPLNLNYDLKSLRTALSKIDVVVSSGYFVLKLKNNTFNKRYLEYLLYIFDIRKMKTLGAGIRQTLTFRDMAVCDVAIPSACEQTQIASFLDYETFRIDNLIAKQEKLIELLEEQRKSIISHAVSKGLNPNAPMKDSGVEWLGDVPEHWEVISIKFLAHCSSGQGINSLEVLDIADDKNSFPVIGGNGMMGWTSKSNYKEPVLSIGRVGALCGNVHLINYPSWISDNSLILKVYSKKVNLEILQYILLSRNLNNLASKSAQPLITGTQVKNEKITLPPPNEQSQILQYIIQNQSRINNLIAKQKTLIEKLKEYRASIISHAVTGKIDVREFGA